MCKRPPKPADFNKSKKNQKEEVYKRTLTPTIITYVYACCSGLRPWTPSMRSEVRTWGQHPPTWRACLGGSPCWHGLCGMPRGFGLRLQSMWHAKCHFVIVFPPSVQFSFNKISQINKKRCKFLLSIVQVNMTKLTRQVNTPLYNFC